MAAKNRVLQIRQKPYYGRPHGVRTFDGAAVSFSANGAHSGHKIILDLKFMISDLKDNSEVPYIQ